MKSAICNLQSAILILLLSSCTPQTPDLNVGTRAHDGMLNQHFTRAYYSIDDAGSDQVVLVNDPLDQKIPGPPGGPLPSVAVSPIRQVFVARLRWRAKVGTSAGSIAADNAVLHWYVYGGPGAGQSMIHYLGGGFVRIDPDGKIGSIEIKDGSLHLVEKTGDLVDPFQSFTVDGTFSAINNPIQVQAVLADVDGAELAAKTSLKPPVPTTLPTTAPTGPDPVTPVTMPTSLPALEPLTTLPTITQPAGQ